MTMRTARKNRVWTSEFVSLVGSQAGTLFNLSTAFTSKMDRSLAPGDTLAHSWVKGLWSQSAAGDSSAEQLGFGIGFFNAGIDPNDMPVLLDHDGDWQLHDVRAFIEPTTLQTPMVPQQLATIDVESRGQRTVPRAGNAYVLNLSAISLNAPSAGSFELRVAITLLWLVP